MMFVDTSGLLALFNASELQHQSALLYFDTADIKVTSNYVLVEFIALTNARGLPRVQTLSFVSALQHSSEITIIYVHQSIHEAALTLLQQRPDKRWSLCDATSMVIMNQYGIREALTTDHHFEQAGFTRLLRP